MTPPWLPMGADPAKFETLVDGVPAYMEAPLFVWIKASVGQKLFATLQSYDTASRREPALVRSAQYGLDFVINELKKNEGILTFVDFLIYSTGESGLIPTYKLAQLEEILADAGSIWTVGTREAQAGLEKRVPEGVAVAAQSVMSEPGHPGELLSQAWHAAFGREPDHEKAYSKAIKAVEAAAVPVVSPTSTGATLGTVINQMRDQGGWAYPTDRQHGHATPSSVLLGMLQSLWTGQNDRHAGQPDYAPTSRGSAEAAVILAVTLVQWFTSGAIARR